MTSHRLTLLATLAQLDPIRTSGTLYYSDRLMPEDAVLIDDQSATYLDVDVRMAEQLPITGNYFPNDVNVGAHKTPIDNRQLTKFDAIPGISRIYDSGYDRFYDLRGIEGLPDEK